MKNIMKFFGLCLFSLALVACEKDNITNAYFEENPERLNEVASDLRKALASSEDGWVMMVKSNLNAEVYTPIVLKFDTITNRVHVTTVYGVTNNTEDYFRISNGTGSPQLIFTTGSIMSTLYRVGIQASDITDHIYNLVSVSADTIAIRGYRSGRVYTPEGGVIYKMFKRPAEWTWAENPVKFDWTNPAFTNNVNSVIGEMKFEYKDPSANATFGWRFWSWSDPTVYRIRDPFAIGYNIGTGGFKPMNYFIITGGVTNDVNTTVSMGHNAISIYPIPYNTGTNQSVIALGTKIKTHYLILKNEVRTNDNVKMEFEAYDQKGNVIVKAFYDNLR
ncbi:DUF4302 domain-containing protein [Sphingobacterium hungaricum]|uniref:DUF4302 domain-containing protein n=1 Tax=Sphingobacterium hungaricum TaxID=2082723 RepID=A0A928UWL7_9SPHI|nr:DUF4302 domain-containing protein [Sphingobacterium hungaricum]MBE8714323.1 DUF4302 domain-containing protein [Sphingobacterium hungaricum]